MRNVEVLDSSPTLQHKTRKLNYFGRFGENLGMLEVYNGSKTRGRFREAVVRSVFNDQKRIRNLAGQKLK